MDIVHAESIVIRVLSHIYYLLKQKRKYIIA